MNADAVVARAQEAGVHLVSFLYCDNAGIIRTKSTHVVALAGRMGARGMMKYPFDHPPGPHPGQEEGTNHI